MESSCLERMVPAILAYLFVTVLLFPLRQAAECLNVTTHGVCPLQELCVWEKENFLNCSPPQKYHCAWNPGLGRMDEACATPQKCGIGKEPQIIDTESIKTVECRNCHDWEHYYNPISERDSYTFDECDYGKHECTSSDNKFQCEVFKEVDLYSKNTRCRCDVRNGYRSDKQYKENEHVCSYEKGLQCILSEDYPKNDILLIGYRNAAKCPVGSRRSSQYTDECILERVNSTEATSTSKNTIAVSSTRVTKPAASAAPTRPVTSPPVTTTASGEGNSNQNTVAIAVGVTVGIFGMVVVVIFLIRFRRKILEWCRNSVCNVFPCNQPPSEFRERIPLQAVNSESQNDNQSSGDNVDDISSRIVEEEIMDGEERGDQDIQILNYDDLHMIIRNELYKMTLDGCTIKLVEDMCPEQLLLFFIEKFNFWRPKIQDIEEEKYTSTKNRQIIDLIRKSGWEKYFQFKEGLKKTHQENLLSVLQDKEKELIISLYQMNLDRCEPKLLEALESDQFKTASSNMEDTREAADIINLVRNSLWEEYPKLKKRLQETNQESVLTETELNLSNTGEWKEKVKSVGNRSPSYIQRPEASESIPLLNISQRRDEEAGELDSDIQRSIFTTGKPGSAEPSTEGDSSDDMPHK